MTANELANKLDEYNKDGFPVLVVEQAATMLRKQAKQIAHLEMISNSAEIADLLQHQADFIDFLEKALDSSIKLNKAQAERQEKELTDSEIEKVFWEIANKKIDNPVMEFAKAILKKAQEK